MFDVVTFGSATIDVFIGTGEKLFGKQKQGHIKVPFGSKILVKDIGYHGGGGGTNSGIALSRMGLRTAFIGNISTSSRIVPVESLLAAMKRARSALVPRSSNTLIPELNAKKNRLSGSGPQYGSG